MDIVRQHAYGLPLELHVVVTADKRTSMKQEGTLGTVGGAQRITARRIRVFWQNVESDSLFPLKEPDAIRWRIFLAKATH